MNRIPSTKEVPPRTRGAGAFHGNVRPAFKARREQVSVAARRIEPTKSIRLSLLTVLCCAPKRPVDGSFQATKAIASKTAGHCARKDLEAVRTCLT